MAAIATCASGAVNRPEVGPDPDETGLGNKCDHGWSTQQKNTESLLSKNL